MVQSDTLDYELQLRKTGDHMTPHSESLGCGILTCRAGPSEWWLVIHSWRPIRLDRQKHPEWPDQHIGLMHILVSLYRILFPWCTRQTDRNLPNQVTIAYGLTLEPPNLRGWTIPFLVTSCYPEDDGWLGCVVNMGTWQGWGACNENEGDMSY